MLLFAFLYCALDFIAWSSMHTVFVRLLLLYCICEEWHAPERMSFSHGMRYFLLCMQLTVMSGMVVPALIIPVVMRYGIFAMRTLFDTKSWMQIKPVGERTTLLSPHYGFIMGSGVIFLIIDQVCIKKALFFTVGGVYSTFLVILVNMVLMYMMMGMRDNRSALHGAGRKVWTPSRKGAS